MWHKKRHIQYPGAGSKNWEGARETLSGGKKEGSLDQLPGPLVSVSS